MPSGSKRRRGDGEYIFIDGRAMRAGEAVRVELDDTAVPGQEAAAAGQRTPDGVRREAPSRRSKARTALDRMEADGLELTDEASEGRLSYSASDSLLASDRRSMRRKYAVVGAVLAALTLLSLCISSGYNYQVYALTDVFACYGAWVQISLASLSDPPAVVQMRYEISQQLPMYQDVLATALDVFKYLVCGVLLALSGALYQNAFRNPIAAPSMLGVANGVSFGLLMLVVIFGTSASMYFGYYYLFAYLGGAAVLVLVIAGGKFISGKGRFNVVNMLLVGTIISQLLGVVITYVQNTFMTESEWQLLYELQNATVTDNIYTYLTLLVGGIVTIVPIVALRFRINLVSFSDEETRLLGVDPNRLRLLVLVCGSIMILTAQVNAGQVAMASLVIPFIVRAVFGAEFRKQLLGNVLFGAIIQLVGGDIVSFVEFSQIQLDIGSVVTVCALPLFIWMIAVQQRGWE